MKRLSPRQQQILLCIADGLPDKRIAHELGISAFTVKDYMKVLLNNLAATNRAHAVSIAFRVGYLKYDGNGELRIGGVVLESREDFRSVQRTKSVGEWVTPTNIPIRSIFEVPA